MIVWEVVTGKLITSLQTRQSGDVAFTPDGTLLVAPDGEGLSIWSTQTWKKQKQLKTFFEVEYERISISADGRLVADCGLAIESEIWDIATGKVLKELPQMRDLAFAPTGHLLAGADRDAKIKLVDLGGLVPPRPVTEHAARPAANPVRKQVEKPARKPGLIAPPVAADATRMQQAIINNNVGTITRVLEGHPTAVRWKLGKKNGSGLHMAAYRGNVAMVRLLLKYDADPNARNQENRVPLGSAAGAGHVAVAKLLLHHGANPSLRNESGQTPLDLARLNGHEAVVRLLESAGKK